MYFTYVPRLDEAYFLMPSMTRAIDFLYLNVHTCIDQGDEIKWHSLEKKIATYIRLLFSIFVKNIRSKLPNILLKFYFCMPFYFAILEILKTLDQ